MTIAVSLGALAALAACGGTSTNSPGGGGSSGSTVATGTAGGNTVLTNSAGLTLYYLSTEQGGVDKCTAQSGCPQAWPAIAPPSSGAPAAGSGVSGTLSVINAADGTKEVAYNGWPLHTFSSDSAPGQTGGNNITSFGGTWFIATPSLTASGGTGGSTSPSSSAPATTPYGY
jgi:predicted lipoprotein with Yx(FWY)xxD motif